jgi:hypothetical protein
MHCCKIFRFITSKEAFGGECAKKKSKGQLTSLLEVHLITKIEIGNWGEELSDTVTSFQSSRGETF